MEIVGGTEVTKSLLPTHKSKTSFAIMAPRAVKRITFDKSEASPGETLYVRVPKLNKSLRIYGRRQAGFSYGKKIKLSI